MIEDGVTSVHPVDHHVGGHHPHLHGGVGEDVAECPLTAGHDEVGDGHQRLDGFVAAGLIAQIHQRIGVFTARFECLIAELLGIDAEAGEIGGDPTAQIRERCLPGGIPRIAGDLQHHGCLPLWRHKGAAPARLLQTGRQNMGVGEVLPGVVRQVLLFEGHIDEAKRPVVQIARQAQMLAGERQRQGGDHLIKALALLHVILFPIHPFDAAISLLETGDGGAGFEQGPFGNQPLPQGGEDLAEAVLGIAVFAGIGAHRHAAVAPWQQAARHVFEIDQADALASPVGGELVRVDAPQLAGVALEELAIEGAAEVALDPLGKARLGKIGGLLGKGQQQQILHRTGHQGQRRRLEQIGQVQGVVVGAPAKADDALALGVEQVVPHQLVDKGEQLGVLGDEAVAAVVEAILAVAPLEGLGGAHAAHDRLLFEQGDRKTGLAQAPGGHQTGRAGAQHRNVLLVVVVHECSETA